jgi:hypothetical protein
VPDPQPIPAAVLEMVPNLDKFVAKVRNMSQTQTQPIYR